MFKKISLVTVVLAGVLLAGCSQQSATQTDTGTKTEKTQKKSTAKKSANNANSATTKTNDDSNQSSNDDSDTDSQSSYATTKSSTASDDSNSSKTTGNNNSSNGTTDNSTDQQSTQSNNQGTINLTTSDQAVNYLADQLSNTYDKTTTQYVANGRITWDNVQGYQVNIYSKNSDSPVGSYLVPANGQYFQIW
ncbi:hypothetical protein [Companilactobacillus hulinensis]|uniref:hypothetical protein n=1 Tax=Companilactobacillus hulinensis TaxID=2486007 RepID=UPI000F76F1DD|nr:hypothetical protein [Companilactobacillus hulinensis]